MTLLFVAPLFVSIDIKVDSLKSKGRDIYDIVVFQCQTLSRNCFSLCWSFIKYFWFLLLDLKVSISQSMHSCASFNN